MHRGILAARRSFGDYNEGIRFAEEIFLVKFFGPKRKCHFLFACCELFSKDKDFPKVSSAVSILENTSKWVPTDHRSQGGNYFTQKVVIFKTFCLTVLIKDLELDLLSALEVVSNNKLLHKVRIERVPDNLCATNLYPFVGMTLKNNDRNINLLANFY